MNYPIFDFGDEAGEPHEDGSRPRGRNHISFSVSTSTTAFSAVRRVAPVHFAPLFSPKSKRNVTALHSDFATRAVNRGFEAKSGQVLSVDADGCDVVHFGLGKREKFSLHGWASALSGACKSAGSLRVSRISVALPEGLTGRKRAFGNASFEEIGRITAQTITMALHEGLHYKTKEGGHEEHERIGEVAIVPSSGLSDKQKQRLQVGLTQGAAIGASINMARDLGDMPPNLCTPAHMMLVARRIGEDFPDTCKVTILGQNELQKKQMNCLLAVAAGSAEEPGVAIVEYTPAEFAKDSPVIAYVGKTVTFDTGGMDLKNASGMSDMNYDMCGGADVLAAIRAIAALGVPVRVKAFIGATTNRTGPAAYLPRDVIPAGMFPKTVEVDNTDAEGRLTLVDVISLAIKEYGVTHVVDYATLTGAVITALGHACTGLVSNNDEWCDKYLAAAKACNENAHRFPLLDEYKKQIKSKRADLKNTGGSGGAGSITAGAFVLEAAPKTPIVHADIAGTGFGGNDATGWGVATLVKLAEMEAAA
jgi:leucyl aminopeptidase